MIAITPIYAALCALFFVYLSFRVIGQRRNTKTSLGDGGHDSLQQAIRVHGNFAEYVPMTIVLMALAELQSAPALALHAVGIALIVGRLLHAYAIPSANGRFQFRVSGMILTFLALAAGALLNLGLSFL